MANINGKEFLYLIYEKNLIIPYFQREYKWSSNNIITLFKDLQEWYEKSQMHHNTKNSNGEIDGYYIGTIVIKKENNNKYLIIDGQQRIISILILILSINFFNKSFIFDTKSISNIEWQCDRYSLSEIIEKCKKIENILNWDKISKNYSNYLNMENVQKFKENINSFLNFLSESFDFSQKYLKNWKHIIEKIQVAVIELEEYESEYTAFEKINSTSIPLSPGELIKNYLWSEFWNQNKSLAIQGLYDYFDELIPDSGDKSSFFRIIITILDSKNDLYNENDLEIFYKFKEYFEKNYFHGQNYDHFISNFKKHIEIWNMIQSSFSLSQMENSEITNNPKIALLKSLISHNFKNWYAFIHKYVEFSNAPQYKNAKIDDDFIYWLSQLLIFRQMAGIPQKNITRDVPRIFDNFESTDIDMLSHLKQYFLNADKNWRMPDLKEMFTISQINSIYNSNQKMSKYILLIYLFEYVKDKKDERYFKRWNSEFFSRTILSIKTEEGTFAWKNYQVDHIFPNKSSEYINYDQYNIASYKNTLGNLQLLEKKRNIGKSNKITTNSFNIDNPDTYVFSQELSLDNHDNNEEYTSETIVKRTIDIMKYVCKFLKVDDDLPNIEIAKNKISVETSKLLNELRNDGIPVMMKPLTESYLWENDIPTDCFHFSEWLKVLDDYLNNNLSTKEIEMKHYNAYKKGWIISTFLNRFYIGKPEENIQYNKEDMIKRIIKVIQSKEIYIKNYSTKKQSSLNWTLNCNKFLEEHHKD